MSRIIMSLLSKKVALITGASSGIGRATALLLAKNGASLGLVARDVAALEETRKLCLNQGLSPENAIILPSDVTRESDCENAVNEIIKHLGKLDILVNGAGMLAFDTIENIGSSNSPSGNRFEAYERMMNTNVTSAVMLSHFAVPHLIASHGCIVNISSVNGQRSFPNVMSYCMSKAAIDQFTRCAALDLASKGVRVNAVCPGVTRTNLHRRAGLTEEKYQQFLERSTTTHALGRVGEPEEVAEAVLFLASDHSSFCTGVTLPVDGGRHAMCPR